MIDLSLANDIRRYLAITRIRKVPWRNIEATGFWRGGMLFLEPPRNWKECACKHEI